MSTLERSARCMVAVAVVVVLSACSSTRPTTIAPPSGPRPTTGPTVASSSPAPTAPSPSPAASPSSPTFIGSISPIDAVTRAAMVSWHQGCPVGVDDLRLLSLSYWGFDGRSRRGRLIANADVAPSLVRVFHTLFEARFPIRRMEPVDVYAGDDERSMTADNTSGFNCRRVPGSTSWSEHAYGRAVDVNPLENPEVDGSTIDPPAAAPYADRSNDARGMIRPGDAVTRAFASIGWGWGGSWRSLKDWQHFSATGR